MSLDLSPRPRSSPVLSRSLPPSPDEQDIGGRDPWNLSDDELDGHGVSATEHSLHSKGKAKLLANGGTDELSHWHGSARNTEAYPPTTEEEADTRRVREVRACLISYLSLTSGSR